MGSATLESGSTPLLAGGSDWKPYVLPFAVLILLLGLGPYLGLNPPAAYPVRTIAVFSVLLIFSRAAVVLRPARPVSSILLGIAVFVIWIAPDLVFPGYRLHWVFQNGLTAATTGGLPSVAVRKSLWYVCFRLGGAVLLVPVVEELFWRAWLMRWLISPDFSKVPLGSYAAQAFWISAVLFASEHGPYWDVGLASGVLYNWWMVRTRSLADCILAHAVTNACLAAYVLAGDHWQYWL